VRDLAFARTLSVRQSVRAVSLALRTGAADRRLQTVTVTHAPALAAEGRALRQWCRTG